MDTRHPEPSFVFKVSSVAVGLVTGTAFIYFPIPILVLVSVFLVFAKTRWLRPVPWWVLAAMMGGLVAIALVLETS